MFVLAVRAWYFPLFLVLIKAFYEIQISFAKLTFDCSYRYFKSLDGLHLFLYL